ncbi:MAG: DUF1499 domain-containing protein [Gemmatimonadetes bacterium]|nr:DUF1499 domain-containing protein [Gemmatimonadota bacterium]
MSAPESRARRAVVAFALVATACTGTRGAVTTPGQPLAPCPGTPNCVSTEAPTSDTQHAMPPVPFPDAPAAAQARAKAALLAEPRTAITLEAPGYLRAEATSLLFRFVDDVEIVVDSTARVIRFRSASRIGKGDMGVNRKRMERVGARLAMPAPPPAKLP